VPRPREPPPLRERELVLRFAVERLDAGRDDFAAPVERFAAGFFAADERVVAVFAGFARDDVLRAPELFRAGDLRAVLFRPPVLLDAFEDPALTSPSIVHLPDMTRCAASATASAMIEPSLVALDIMLVAAAEAVSAASRPASRIFRRAAGLALIAAAAAASPAASISLLIAALASLSMVSFREEEPDDFLVDDLAIA
jgi:hypothetical protein